MSIADKPCALFRSGTAQVPARARFRNTAKTQDGSAALGQIIWRYLTQKVADKTPRQPIPVQAADLSGSHDILLKISHSSVLLRLDGQYLLLDPVFSKRASPLQWLGPKRFHALPLQLDELPQLSAVLISHDHYDHLDKHAVRALIGKTRRFIVPLGVDAHLRRFGVPAEMITVLDWWQHSEFNGLKVHATPAQHFSGRGINDKNQTLWASFVIESSQKRLFFSGDSGYFNGFAEIGQRFGPIDVAMVETGAYDELWADIHMQPEQSLRAHLDLQAAYLVPIHNSSFDLAMHAWYEPLERLAVAADAYQAQLVTPLFGAAVDLSQLSFAPALHHVWWRALMPVQVTGQIHLQIPA